MFSWTRVVLPTRRQMSFNKWHSIPNNSGCQPRMLQWSSQLKGFQQTSKILVQKDHCVSSGEVNKLSQHDITTSSHPDIKHTSSTLQSNVTCGSCGQKGHNRKWRSCPNYYTKEESAQRKVHDERRKQKIQEMYLIIIRKANRTSILRAAEGYRRYDQSDSATDVHTGADSQLTEADEMHAVYKKRKK